MGLGGGRGGRGGGGGCVGILKGGCSMFIIIKRNVLFKKNRYFVKNGTQNCILFPQNRVGNCYMCGYKAMGFFSF